MNTSSTVEKGHSKTLRAAADTDSNRYKIGEQYSPLFALIRDGLRERILQGEFPPGSRLVESRLSTEMAVSRIPVREALRALAAEGLVKIEPRRGASVAVLSEDAAYDMVEVRAALEGLNARLVARRRDDAAIAKLTGILEDGTAAAEQEDMEACQQLNRTFHATLASITGNAFLMELMNSLRDRTALVFALSNTRRTKENWSDHAQILRAIIAGNVELAGLLATQHVHNAARAYSEKYREREQNV